MKLSSLTPALVLFGLAACGGDDDGVTPAIDAPVTSIDAPTAIDAPSVTCTVSTNDFGDKGAVTASSCLQDPGDPQDMTDDVIFLRAPLEGGSPGDEVEVQLWAGFGAFQNGIITGTFPITGDELTFATCDVCVFIHTNSDGQDTWDDDYFQTGGSVKLDSVSGNLTGTLSNMTFEHVTVAGGDSTPVGDGCNTAISNATFDSAITPIMNKARAAGQPAVRVKHARLAH